MNGRTSWVSNARVLKGLSLLYLGLLIASLLLVHDASYGPAVSYVPLYLAISVIVTVAVALLLLPAHTFGEGFCIASYISYAIFWAATAFFTGGVSSELYIFFFPLVISAALHGSWRIVLLSQGAVLASYSLAMLPGILEDIEGTDGMALVFFRLAALALTGVFAFLAVGRGSVAGEEGYALDEDGSILLERVSEELAARRGAQVGVILVDPGRWVEDVDLLVERVRARIGEPILLGEGIVFGLVLGGVDDRIVESAARRALAAASSLGAQETRAGAAIYPRDARSAEELLDAAGRALAAAFEIEGPSAIVLAGRDTPGAASSFGAAR